MSLKRRAFYIIKSTAALLVAFGTANATAQGSESEVAKLLQKHEALKPQLVHNPFRRPLFLESVEKTNTVSSSVYAVLNSPFSRVSSTLKKPDGWCEVLILHLNTKYCRANTDTAKSTLAVNIGKKTPQPLSDAFSLEFSYSLVTASENYLSIELHADEGPLKTTDYAIVLHAAPLPEGKTFINLRYSYGYGLAGRLAMQGYLSTLGRGKVGFTRTGTDAQSGFVEGMRGAVERNTMRYYLAIEAYLMSLTQPPAQQLDTRLKYWFDATEEYSQQLHEVDRQSYLTMKKEEYQRQQSVSTSTSVNTQ